MPHHPEPFYRASRRSWYVQAGGKQHSLGHHPEDLPEPQKGEGRWNPPPTILHAYHRIMARYDQPATLPVSPGTDDPPTVHFVLSPTRLSIREVIRR